MEREEDKRLVELREQGVHIYSISRLNTMDQCPYQAYLSYIKKEEQKQNCWAVVGSATHDALQACIDTGCDTSIIAEAIKKELEDMDLLGIDFPLDRKGEPSIRNNWIANMSRFAKEFKTPKGNFETEKLILYPVPGRENTYMQGYIDLTKFNDDGTLSIYDWKTSSNFTKEHLVEVGRQLCLYALAKEAEGFTVKKISWVMLKYCVTTWKLKNGKTKEKVSEWRNLGKDMASVVEARLVDEGYSEMDIEIFIDQLKQTNDFSCLPDKIRVQFKTKIYVRDYEFSQENIDETLEYINKMIDKFEAYGDDEDNYKPCEINNKSSFFCSSLCGYGYEKCMYYRDYCTQLQNMMGDNEDDDLF